MLPHGKLLLIVNPTSQSGYGLKASEEAKECLQRLLGSHRVDAVHTQYAGHAVEIARNADRDYTTLVALGGDGIIHETVNGIMQRPQDDRPVLGIIPVGSGNDYARSLGVSTNVCKACDAIAAGDVKAVDVGKVNQYYFMETLSFGLDAAIALDTVERRKKSGESGTILYLKSGLDQLFHHLDVYGYEASFQGEAGPFKNRRTNDESGNPADTCMEGISAEEAAGVCDCSGSTCCEPPYAAPVERGQAIMFAVQIGKTYGGGFKVCPDAQLDDGLFDICIVHPPLSVPYATFLFLLAKDGHHTGFQQVESFRAEGVRVKFDGPIAAQMDGEAIAEESYDISICPQAMQVIFG